MYLGSQRQMLYNDINYVNVKNEITVYTKRKYKNCYFQQIFLNRNISVINGAKLISFGRLVVGGHLEGTVSQFFCLGPSFHFMNSRKFSCKNRQKVSRFLT